MRINKAVLISIRPEWCEKIICGRKTMELRKSAPNMRAPFKCYIYMTKHRWVFRLLAAFGMSSLANLLEKSGGKVIGSFVCDSILEHCEMANADIAEQQSLVKREKILQYANGKPVYGWHISDLKIYDRPRDVRDFHCFGHIFPINRPPQSWCYVEDIV